MKSSEIALLFFVLWSLFLECVLIYQYFKRRKIMQQLIDQEMEITRLYKERLQNK